LKSITFEELSTLKKIEERAFTGCGLKSITIPASTEEIDGSAFLGCPLIGIRITPESDNFVVHRNMLLTTDGTVIV
jgi:hypothetical protein